MKNRIDACFEKLKAENKKALVTFITAGDPDMDTTEKCVLEMYKNGSDIIEIGVPFSDPIAEGATIQKASLRSLSGGTNLDKIFDLVRKLRTQTDKPMLLMMYINTIFKFGTAKFFELCKETQIDALSFQICLLKNVKSLRARLRKMVSTLSSLLHRLHTSV